MPEGPSIVLLREDAERFAGRKVLDVTGNTTVDKERLRNKKLMACKTWGKHFLLVFNGFSVRIHFLLFGSYLVDDTKEAKVRLGLRFTNGTINFYACSIKFLEGDIDDHYDWSADVMNDAWDPRAARKKLKSQPHELVCDALLDQDIFAGVGNIIKNEVLYRIRVHPASHVGALPSPKLTKLISEARNYSFDFLAWKRVYVLRKHWLAHAKKTCLRCNLPIIKQPAMGKRKRRSFFCANCQLLYT
jgi:endonuclease-8